MLDFSGLNYWAVLIAWLVNVGIGAFWYSPQGFGIVWSKLSGVDMMKIPKEETSRAIVYVTISSLLQALALAIALNSLNVQNVGEGLIAGLFLWFGFTAITTIGNTLYQRQSWKFWWLNASFFLAVMTINSIILSFWM